ncbi:MAG: ribbon-helix-helix protein, CopG family [Bryobacteraceae bacterium]
MPASSTLKLLSVRLPEAELRRFKSLAASRGVSVQTAVHQALEAWASQVPRMAPEPLDALEGSLADVDVVSLRRWQKEEEYSKDQRWL